MVGDRGIYAGNRLSRCITAWMISFMSARRYRLLVLSTPVGPLGSGLGGGVELCLKNATQGLLQRGHHITVVAPETSVLDTCDRLIPIAGNPQPTAHTSRRNSPIIMPEPSMLAAMWAYARQVQQDYDIILHFAYDWLPFYLTPFFQTPIAHFVSMGSLTDAMDVAISQVAQTLPNTVGVFTQTQAATFPHSDSYRILGSAIDLACYSYCESPTQSLAWMGRISPEKGLEDAIAAAQQTQMPLKIMGKLEDHNYWDHLQQTFPNAPIDYRGFLNTQTLQATLRTCQALLMTPKWIEAFGLVAIEALACGVPVIAYRRGGPTEIIQEGKTGWLVEPDSVTGLVQAIQHIAKLDRAACRHQAEVEYSIEAMAVRYEAWFRDILASV